jgi:general secretion pathway protein D
VRRGAGTPAERLKEADREKEFALRTTAGTAFCSIALVWGASVGAVHAQPARLGHIWLAAMATSQPEPINDQKPSREEVLGLLKQARAAMQQGDLGQANDCISRAEAMDVSLGVFHLGDTPKKARRDLERLRAKAASSTRPARPKAPDAKGESASGAGVERAAEQRPRMRESGGSAVEPLPPTDTAGAGGARPRRTAATAGQQIEIISSPPSSEAIRSITPVQQPDEPPAEAADDEPPLLKARRALAAGDVQSARAFVEQVEQSPQSNQAGNDSPEAVRALVERQQALANPRAGQSTPQQKRRELVGLMLDQAEGLLRWGDLDGAEQLAQQALGLKANYGAFERGPEAILERIAHMRGAAPAKAVAPGKATDAVEPAAYQEPVQADFHQSPEQAIPSEFDLPQESANDSPFADKPPLTASPPQAPPRPTRPGQRATSPAEANRAVFYLNQGEAALDNGDMNTARAYFAKASENQDQLSQQDRVRLSQHLSLAQKQRDDSQSKLDGGSAAPQAIATRQSPGGENRVPQAVAVGPPTAPAASQASGAATSLATPGGESAAPPAAEQSRPRHSPPEQAVGSLLHEYSAGQRVLHRQLSAQVANQQSRAQQMKESDPKAALELLKQARVMIEAAKVEPEIRDQLLRRVARTTEDVQAYYEAHRAEIELNEKNRATLEQIEREKQVKVEIDEKLALLVDEYNKLMDEQRWHEAAVVAKKAIELAPKNPLAEQLRWNANFVIRFNQQRQIQLDKEDGFVNTLVSVDESSVPFDDRNPISFGNKLDWEKLTDRRRKLAAGDRPRRNERELQIEQKLKTPVSLQFKDAPLSQVLMHLGDVAGINIHIDPEGLAAEGVSSDTPVTINLKQDISLKSALNLILESLHLGYVIKDEVLKITSEQAKSGELTPVMYPVADLVIPIPNFVPGSRMGLAGSLHEAYTSLGYGGVNGYAGQSPLAVVASKDGAPNSAMVNPALLANVGGSASTMAALVGSNNVPVGAGPGGAGGGVAPDFDSLIQLITSTIAPTTWDEVGGSGSIEEYRTNLSLVISQTEDVHDQIRDLLEQLRRLQDLQVTIEVRFITLNDNFFERIGVDFDFNIGAGDAANHKFQVFGRPDPTASTTYTAPPANGFFNTVPRTFDNTDFSHNTTVVGLQAPDVFSSDLDIPFRQNSFGLAVPQFGGFDPTAGASLGFAILSDIEAFFFINAAQGDSRTNVLQAPKVTLFNGQQATVSDTSQSPFVISVIPVVGDFAAAQQPVIVVLNEGTFMTVQATVSSDRRFVRLTIVPFFSKISNVSTFTFEGSSTTKTTSSSDGPADATTKRSDDKETVTSGTTVQLPTFSFVTVTTTVSVPDGGTVLLGGIKRLREGRNEFGVPILSKLPYINRLFKNVGIGRETQSLMMMVTPRIIIQEEEEQLLGTPPTP